MGPAILLYRGRGFISKAIMWRTWGIYSHAALLTASGTVIEAWHFGGVREAPFVDDPAVDKFVIRGATPAQWIMVEDYMRSQVGQPYDYLGILRFLLRLDSHNTAWFCSELLAEAWREAGLPLLIRPSHQISPQCIATSPLLFRIDK